MLVEMLVIEPDGSQHIELMEVADNWFTEEEEAAPEEN